jgi:hypothetical protein
MTIISTAKELKMDVIGHVPMSVSVNTLWMRTKLIAHSEEVAKHAGGNYSAGLDYFADMMAKRGSDDSDARDDAQPY